MILPSIAGALDHRLESPMAEPALSATALYAEDVDLPVDGIQLRGRWIRHRRDHDLSSEPTLVFLHEGLGSIVQWRDFPEALARRTGLAALIYDRLGHGGSPPLSGPRTMHYLETEACQVLPSVLAAAGIQAPVLVGHSDGGTIALLFASKFPEVPRAVISEAAHVLLEPITLQGLCTTVEAFTHGSLRAKLARYHGEKTDSLFHGWSDTWLDPASEAWDITPQMHAITAPLLLIQGEGDDYGSPAQIEAVTSRAKGHAESLLIPGCGHVPHSQAREVVLARMAAFVKAFAHPS